jgi:hypothetical protein
MVGGALFDQFKSDKSGMSRCGHGRRSDPRTALPHRSPAAPFSHRCIVLSHTSAFPLHKAKVRPSFLLNAKHDRYVLLLTAG